MSAVKSTIASIFSRISRSRCAGRLEDIHGLTTHCLAEQGFDHLPVDDIRGGTDEVGDIAREAGIGEQAERMRGIQVDEDVGITVWTGVGSVAKLPFRGKIRKSCVGKSMTCESKLSCFR